MDEVERSESVADPFERSLSLAIGSWYVKTIIGFIGGLLLAFALQDAVWIFTIAPDEFRITRALGFGILGAILFITYLKLERTSRANPNYWSKDKQ